jgi:uroporphyrinogen decarboxylase
MAQQFSHDPMINYTIPQNNYLLTHTGAYNDLSGVTVELEVKEKGGSELTVRRRFTTPAGVLTDTRGVTRPGDASGFDHIIEPLVKDRKDLDKISFLLPPPENAYVSDIPLLQEAIGEAGLLTVKPTQGVDQLLMDAVGVQNALMLYYDDRELLSRLLRIFNDYHRAILKRMLEAGVLVVFEPWYNCSMSVGWSPGSFRELFLPRIKENVELVHSYDAYVNYFDDGKMDAVLEDLADVGIDVVETLSPKPLGDVDLASAKRRVGDRLCLKGHIDQINLICFGKPAQIREAVRKAIEIAAPGSGFILGTSDSIRPESPPENIKAYFDAAREFGNVK